MLAACGGREGVGICMAFCTDLPTSAWRPLVTRKRGDSSIQSRPASETAEMGSTQISVSHRQPMLSNMIQAIPTT